VYETNAAERKRENKMTLIERLEATEELLVVNDLAKLLKLSAGAIYRHVRKGNLPAVIIGETIRFDPKVIAAQLRSQKAGK
jgi:excisionase family DNA binding protein